MKVPKLHPFFVALLTLATTAGGQNAAAPSKNNPYSPSPSGKVVEAKATLIAIPVPTSTPTRTGPEQIEFVVKDNRATDRENATAAISEPKRAVSTELSSQPASSIYRIGVGDVVHINLKNSAQGSGYYTVRDGGVIDYPLAGPNVQIADKTTDEIAAMLRSSIKLFANPQVEVKVEYYLSRSFTVDGLANNPGEKVLRREAMPVFAIRAESDARREANAVAITRAKGQNTEKYTLTDPATDNVLIYAGDRIEFIEEKQTEPAQYTISGVRKPLVAGARLSHAIAEALGAKTAPKYAIIKRVDENGVETVSEYEVGAVKKGKVIDPVLSPGDMIEIKN